MQCAFFLGAGTVFWCWPAGACVCGRARVCAHVCRGVRVRAHVLTSAQHKAVNSNSQMANISLL